MTVKINKLVISIGGPTGVGKSNLAIRLAQKYNIPILSADSRQIYKELNVGSGKVSQTEMKGIPHFFLSTHSIKKPITTGQYEKEVIRWLKNYFKEKDTVIVCGGTGLYHKAICSGLDKFPEVLPDAREKINQELKLYGLEMLLKELKDKDPEYYSEVEKRNPRRVTRALEVIRSSGKKFSSFRTQAPKERFFDCLKFFISEDRAKLYERINARVDQMLEDGLEKEAKGLFSYRELPSMRTVGYREFFDYFQGNIDYDETVRLIKRNSRRYAKRQLTWYRNQGWKEFGCDQQDAIEEWLEAKFRERDLRIPQSD